MKYLAVLVPVGLLMCASVAWISAQTQKTPPRAKPPVDEKPPEKLETATFALG